MRSPGIEPGSFAWEAKILPLDHERDFCPYYKTTATSSKNKVALSQPSRLLFVFVTLFQIQFWQVYKLAIAPGINDVQYLRTETRVISSCPNPQYDHLHYWCDISVTGVQAVSPKLMQLLNPANPILSCTLVDLHTYRGTKFSKCQATLRWPCEHALSRRS